MLIGASMGAVAFQKDLGATHSLAHPLSTLCGVHHGTANALCLVAVMKFNASRKPGLYRRIGIACGLDVVKDRESEADLRTIAFIEKFVEDVGIKGRLRGQAIREDQLDALADQAIEDPCHQTNPVPVTREDLRSLYHESL